MKKHIPTVAPVQPIDPASYLAPDLGLAEAYEAHCDEASALAERDVVTLNADPHVALQHCLDAVVAIAPLLPRAAADLAATTPVEEVASVANVARGLVYATLKVDDRERASGVEIQERYRSLQSRRAPMLLNAQSLALLGLLPASQVDAIVEGQGLRDHAGDGVALASLFREHADTLAGRHPFTEVDLKLASDDGNWLLNHVLPDGAPTPPTARGWATQRDRFWSLLLRRYDLLRRVAVLYWGEAEADRRVSRLHARTPAPTPRAEEPALDKPALDKPA